MIPYKETILNNFSRETLRWVFCFLFHQAAFIVTCKHIVYKDT